MGKQKSRLSAQSGAQHRHPDALPARSIGLGEAGGSSQLNQRPLAASISRNHLLSPSSQAATRAIPLIFLCRFPPAHVPWSSLIMFQRPPHGSIQTPAHMSLLSEPLYSQQLGQGPSRAPRSWADPASQKPSSALPAGSPCYTHSTQDILMSVPSSPCHFLEPHPALPSLARYLPSSARLGMSQTASEQAPSHWGFQEGAGGLDSWSALAGPAGSALLAGELHHAWGLELLPDPLALLHAVDEHEPRPMCWQ